MNKPVFEVHNFEETTVPVVFHRGVAKRGDLRIGNWHEDIEILYCYSGEGVILCGGNEYDFSPGDVCVINSNEVHCSKSHSLLDRYCLIVDSAFLRENRLDPSALEFEHFPNDPTAGEFFRQIIAEFESDRYCRSTSIRVLVLSLVLHLTRNHASPRSNRFLVDDTIKLAVGYLKSNYAKRITLDEIANEVGLSKYHFSRKFKNTIGMTVIEYLNTIRCQNARKLLLKQKYTIAQVADLCGFESSSYFSRIFKNTTGILPSEVVKSLAEFGDEVGSG